MHENPFKLIVMMVAQLCDYTEPTENLHFKWVNFMLRVLDLNTIAKQTK